MRWQPAVCPGAVRHLAVSGRSGAIPTPCPRRMCSGSRGLRRPRGLGPLQADIGPGRLGRRHLFKLAGPGQLLHPPRERPGEQHEPVRLCGRRRFREPEVLIRFNRTQSRGGVRKADKRVKTYAGVGFCRSILAAFGHEPGAARSGLCGKEFVWHGRQESGIDLSPSSAASGSSFSPLAPVFHTPKSPPARHRRCNRRTRPLRKLRKR